MSGDGGRGGAREEGEERCSRRCSGGRGVSPCEAVADVATVVCIGCCFSCRTVHYKYVFLHVPFLWPPFCIVGWAPYGRTIFELFVLFLFFF